MKVSSTTQAAAQLSDVVRQNRPAATLIKMAAQSGAGMVGELVALSRSLEMLQKSAASAPPGPLGSRLDVRA